MPAVSSKQANFFRMTKATQHGHKLKGLRPGTQAELQQTATSMKPSDVEDFTRTAKDRKPAWGGRKPTGRYRKRIKAQEVEEGDFRL